MSGEAWQALLATGVTPRFPQASRRGARSAGGAPMTGAPEHAASFVLHFAYAATTGTELGAREVMALQRTRFAQRTVLRVRLPACRALT